MEKKTESRRKFMKVAVWVVVIFALLAITHILVNSFDLFDFVRKLHGG